MTPLEKVELARDHKVSRWLVEGLTSLVVGDPELSPDALEEALGLRTAFRIAVLQGKLYSRAAISPLSTPLKDKGKGEQAPLVGFSLGAMYHEECFKPLIRTDFACHSCSQVLKVKDQCAVGVDNTAFSVQFKSRDGGAYLNFDLSNIMCALCRNLFVTSTMACQSCNEECEVSVIIDDFPSILLFLGSRLLNRAMAEEAVKEMFKDEITDLEMY